jgi:hypothetical protein
MMVMMLSQSCHYVMSIDHHLKSTLRDEELQKKKKTKSRSNSLVRDIDEDVMEEMIQMMALAKMTIVVVVESFRWSLY